MTKTKSLRKALITSAVSMVLCSSMFVGTTYAWFTDSVTSSGNIIQTGTLDVSLEHTDTILGVDDEGWTDASTGAIFNYSNWEPGYTAVKYVKIENEGTLDLKFILNIVPNNAAEEVNLADVIEVYMVSGAVEVERTALTTDSEYFVGNLTSLMNETDGAAHGVLYADDADKAGNVYEIYTIALKMSTSADNEYMGKNVGGGFAVQLLASQLASESDGFNNQYDAGAEYAITANSDASLHSALVAGGNVIIDGEIDNEIIKTYSNGNTREVYLNSESSEITLSGGKIILDENATYGLYPYAKGNPITVKDMEVESNAKFGIVAWPSTATDLVTIENVDVKAAGGVGIYAYGPGKTVVNNCTIGQSGLAYAETPWANTAIAAATGAVFEINGGEYTGTDYVLWIYNSGATVTINGGTFNGAIKVDAGSVTINAGTFSVDPSNVSGVTVTGTLVKNGDGTWTVTAAN